MLCRLALFSFLALFCSAVQADEPLPNTVSLSVVVVEVDTGKLNAEDAAEKLLKQIAELEKKGEIRHLERIRMTAVEGVETSMQFGQSTPVISGRTMSFSRGAGGAATPRTMNSYRTVETGTIVQCQTAVQEETILCELEFEQSRLIPLPAKQEGEPPTTTTGTTSIHTTLRIPDGGTVMASGATKSENGKSVQKLVLVSAKVTHRAKKPAAAQVRIYNLKYVAAKEAHQALEKILGERSQVLRIAVDARTNALVIAGAAEMQKTIESLLSELDRAGSKPM